MATPTRVKMPRTDSGTPVPNPIRWMCDQGHVHPSFQHAVKCNRRNRSKDLTRASA